VDPIERDRGPIGCLLERILLPAEDFFLQDVAVRQSTKKLGRERLVPDEALGLDCREGMFRQEGLYPVYALERVREHNSALGVILLTASARDLEPARRRLGFTVLRKPMALAGLKEALDGALGPRLN